MNRFCAHYWEKIKKPVSKLMNKVFPYYTLKIQSLSSDEWYETDDLIFHSVFQLLVDYIELQTPFRSYQDRDYDSAARYTDVVAMREFIEDQLNTGLSEEFATFSEADKQQSARQFRQQYVNSLAALDLYQWYKFVYPNRPCGYEYVADSEIVLVDTDENVKFKRYEIRQTTNGHITSRELTEMQEDQQYIEDLQLSRLMKIRRTLWT